MNKMWIYGVNSIFALIEDKPESIEVVWYSRTLDQKQQDMILKQGIACIEKNIDEIKQVCGNAVHQGMVAKCTPPDYLNETELMSLMDKQSAPLLLVLDRIVDPRNLGACLRIAEACGVTAIVFSTKHSVELTPAAIKTASGSAMRVPMARVVNLARTLKWLKEYGLWLSGGTADTEVAYDTVDYTHPTAIVLGSESDGLRRLTREQCDHLVRIPMQGKVESLNASVAAAVLLYEVQRQRRT